MLNCNANVTPRLSGWGKCQLLQVKAIGSECEARKAGQAQGRSCSPAPPAWRRPATRVLPALSLSPPTCAAEGPCPLSATHPLDQGGQPLKTTTVQTPHTHPDHTPAALTCVHTPTHICTHVHTRTHTCTCTSPDHTPHTLHRHRCTHPGYIPHTPHMHTCVHTHAHTRMHTHTYAHTRMHTGTFFP